MGGGLVIEAPYHQCQSEDIKPHGCRGFQTYSFQAEETQLADALQFLLNYGQVSHVDDLQMEDTGKRMSNYL